MICLRVLELKTESFILSKLGLSCFDNSLRTIGHPGFVEDIRNRVADSLRAYIQTFSDLLIVDSLSNEIENLALPVGQFWENDKREIYD